MANFKESWAKVQSHLPGKALPNLKDKLPNLKDKLPNLKGKALPTAKGLPVKTLPLAGLHGKWKGDWTEVLPHDGKDRSHVPPMPLWAAFLRIPQAIVAVIILILTAYAASEVGSTVEGFGLTWFTFILTLLYFIWLGFSVFRNPLYYIPYINLSIEVLVNIFWLASWAVLASEASTISYVERDFGRARLRFVPAGYRRGLNCVKAAAAIGALEWVLFFVTLAYLGISVLRGLTVNFSISYNPPNLEAGTAGPSKPVELQPQASAATETAAEATAETAASGAPAEPPLPLLPSQQPVPNPK